MIDTEALRKKVIDLAIQGKLTQQLPEDGNAEDLYVQIQEEKAKLVKEGKIKKDKTLTEISDDEIPFEIPNNWRWVRIGDATYNHGQKTPDKRFCYIDVGTLDNVNHKLNDNENIIEAKDAPSRAKKIVKYDDVLYSTVRPYLHNICIVDKDFSCEPIASTAFAVMHTFDNCLLSRFLYYWLLSEWFDKYANGDSSKGTLYPAIGEKDFFMGLVPLAPFEEQKRIVKIIDEIFAQIDLINDLQQQYESDREILKEKIIDAGIRGKLTEQLPEDGNAEDLYAHIQKEKANLIKEGKIKKEKPLQEISDKEIPFAIPDNWKWVRFGKTTFIERGGSPRPIKNYITNSENGINWIKIGDVEKGGKYIYSTKEKIIPKGAKKSRYVYPGDFLLTNSMSFGRPYISKVEGCIHDGWLLIRDLKGFCSEYLYYLLSSSYMYGQFCNKASGATVDNLNIDKVNSALIPIPPLKEQERIAAKIDAILELVR